VKSYDVIKRPLLTEKSTQLRELHNQYCFEVVKGASKDAIKLAIEELFKVKVKDIKTMQYRGKRKRVGRSIGMTSAWKKAVVTLAEGNTIELFEGV